MLWQQLARLQHGLGDGHEACSRAARLAAQKLERLALVNAVALHDHALGALDDGTSTKGLFEALVVVIAAKHDLELALQLACLGPGELAEDAELGGLGDERRIVPLEHQDHRTDPLVGDLGDELERVPRVFARGDDSDIRLVLRDRRAGARQIDEPRHHVVTGLGHDSGNGIQTPLVLVRDRDPKPAPTVFSLLCWDHRSSTLPADCRPGPERCQPASAVAGRSPPWEQTGRRREAEAIG